MVARLGDSATSRADLLRALADAAKAGAAHVDAAERLAALFGFDYTPPVAEEVVPSPPPVAPAETSAADARAVQPAPAEMPRLRFWRAESLLAKSATQVEAASRMPDEIRKAARVELPGIRFTEAPLPGKPLIPWYKLWPFLRARLATTVPSRDPDLRRVVRTLALGRPLVRLPRKPRRGWHPRVHIWLDRRVDLAPYWDDYDHLIARLGRLRGRAGLLVSSIREAPASEPSDTGFLRDDYPIRAAVGASQCPPTLRPLALPGSTDLVLTLGDLGQYVGQQSRSRWLSLGRKLRARGITPWALLPVPRNRWSPALSAVWNVACWDRGIRLPLKGDGQGPRPQADLVSSPRASRPGVEALLTLASPAIRVERGLLRDLRFLLSRSDADVGTEHDFPDAPEVRGSVLGVTIEEDKARVLRDAFARLPQPLVREAVATIRRHHAYCSDMFGHMEALGLEGVLSKEQLNDLDHAGVLRNGALTAARGYWAGVARWLHERPAGFDVTSQFGFRDWQRLSGDVLDNDAQQALWVYANPDHQGTLPESVKPETLQWVQERTNTPVSHVLALRGQGELPIDRVELGQGSSDDLHAAWANLAVWWAGQVKAFPLTIVRSSQSFVLVREVQGRGEHEQSGPLHKVSWNEWQFPVELLRSATQLLVVTDREVHQLGAVERPSWAERMWYDRQGLGASFGGRHAPCVLRWVPPISRPVNGPLAVKATGWWHRHSGPAWAENIAVDEFGVRAEFSVEGVPFVLRWIPPGTFMMGATEDDKHSFGDELPRHQVTITRGFWMGETPVQQNQWEGVLNAIPPGAKTGVLGALLRVVQPQAVTLKPNPSSFRGTTLPVEQVSWDDAVEFCARLQAIKGLQAGLPTEAQWEYACRAGTSGAFHDGSLCTLPDGRDPALDPLGWFGKNSEGTTHPAREKRANPWGLYDMHGNVWEWCRDDQREYSTAATVDPEGDTSGADRVVRGGSWSNSALFCRAASRFRWHRGDRGEDLGFRLFAGQEPDAAEPRKEDKGLSSASRRGSAEAERKKRKR